MIPEYIDQSPYYIVKGPGCWGRHSNLEIAFAYAKKFYQGTPSKWNCDIYKTIPSAFIDHKGEFRAPEGHEPVILSTVSFEKLTDDERIFLETAKLKMLSRQAMLKDHEEFIKKLQEG